ncbi:MAG: pre-peptidase C-terminal domain-containing protein [Spirosomataceae bacterium]
MKKLLFPVLFLLCGLAAFGQKTADPDPVDPKNPATPHAGEISFIRLPAGLPTNAPPGTAHLAATMTYLKEDYNVPNNTPATAMALPGTSVKVKGTIFLPSPPAVTTDVDYYSFQASAGDRVYAATQTLKDASASGDSKLELIDTDGTTVLEVYNNDGTFNASSSTIAGTLIPTTGTYYLRVSHNVAMGSIRPYDLYLKVQSGTPTDETEDNNTPATATPLPASGWVSGTITAVSPGEADFYSITLNAGETVFLSLDMNPERDAAVWNGRLGFGLFGNPPANQILVANDANSGATASDPNSEAFFFTVKEAGTYFIYVDGIVAAGLGATATYHLSASVLAADNPPLSTTYVSTDVPVTIPTTPGIVSSTLTVPGSPIVKKIRVTINLNHTFMQDLDVELTSPAGNTVGLFSDIGASTVGGAQTLMDITLDDEAALPPSFSLSSSFVIQPELAYSLDWFKGINGGGTWTLTLRDDANLDGGTLNSWSIEIIEEPAVAVGNVLYSSDFETDDGGFTHSGTADEWERGLPTFPPIIGAKSGTNCWKTDLDNKYDASSNQELKSAPIMIPALPVGSKAYVRWAMKYHMESANFDHAYVEVREVGNPTNSMIVWQWLGATMNNTVGSPAVTIAELAGWGIYTVDISQFAGKNIEIIFHLDSDTTVELTGMAVDDVSVFTDCVPPAAPTVSFSPAAICPGPSTTLTATTNCGANTAVWFDNADMPISAPTTTPAVTTTYKLACQESGGCISPKTPHTFYVLAPAAGSIAASQTICSGDNAAAFTSATGGSDSDPNNAPGAPTFAYQWERSMDAGPWTVIGGETAATFDEGVLTNNTAVNVVYSYRRSTVETLSGVTCTSAPSAGITITVKPAPAITPTADQSVCVGQSTTAIVFSSNMMGTVFTWTKVDPGESIGNPGGNGPTAGDIASFVGVNSAAVPNVGTFTVTPVANGCTGAADEFVITVNPTPSSNLTASKVDVCPNTEVTLNPNCSIPSATVQWNPGAPTVTPNAPDLAYTYQVSCTFGGCTGAESSVEVRTHRILVDLKNVGTGVQPKALAGTVKDNLAPTNAISTPASPRLWTILASGCSGSESAVFKLTGPVNFSSIDNNPPYALFANVGTDYFAIDHPNYGNGTSGFPNGTYTLTVDLRGADGVGGPFPKNRVAAGALLATRTLQFTLSSSIRQGVEEAVGVSPWELAEEQWLSVGQNPVNTEVVVRLSGKIGQTIDLSLTNLQGQTIQQRSVVLNSVQQYEVLNVAQAASGMYILKGLKAGEAKTLKVVKIP